MNDIELFKNPLQKKDQVNLINQIIDLILSGEVSPIKAEISLKSMENVIKAIRSDERIKSLTRDETQKYGKSFELFGAKIENSSRTIYDYSQCGDEVYNDLVNQRNKLDEQIKAREMMLKTGVNTDTGELYNSPQAKTTEFLKITFK